MKTEHKEHHLPKRILQPAVVGLLCLGAGIVVGDNRHDRSTYVLLKKHVTDNSIPKAYGRLVTVERRPEVTVLYFEAEDGTIRFVTVAQGIDYGSLKFTAITVPRN